MYHDRGDSGLQAEIVQRVRADVSARIAIEPKNWWKVEDVADLYSRYCKKCRLKVSEVGILAPLGLDHETFLVKQKQMDSELVRQLATELINFEPPDVEAIIAGVDETGVHLYVANNANITCHDNAGFAAIGAGYWHADSQFMFAKHNWAKPFDETLLLVYSAKKRAEVAPGVGNGTDMFMVGPGLGSLIEIGRHVLDKLEVIYQTLQKRNDESAQEAQVSVKKYVREIAEQSTAKTQTTKPAENVPAGAPADKKEA